MSAVQAPASEQYTNWLKYPNTFRRPTDEEWTAELTALRAENKRLDAANVGLAQESHDLQSELTEQCRLNGMGQEREAKLMAQLQEAERKLAEPTTFDQSALDAASMAVHLMLLREGSSWGTKACEEMGRVFMVAYRRALMKEGGE